jgi:hypothetical protein
MKEQCSKHRGKGWKPLGTKLDRSGSVGVAPTKTTKTTIKNLRQKCLRRRHHQSDRHRRRNKRRRSQSYHRQ